MCLKDVMEQRRSDDQVIAIYKSSDGIKYAFHVIGIFETDRDMLKRIKPKYRYAIGLQPIEKENLFIDIEDFSIIQFTHVRQPFFGKDNIIKPNTSLHPIFLNGILYLCSNICNDCTAWIEDKCDLLYLRSFNKYYEFYDLYLRSVNTYYKFYDRKSDKIVLIDGIISNRWSDLIK